MAFDVGAIIGSIKLNTDDFQKGVEKATNLAKSLSDKISANAAEIRKAGLALTALSGSAIFAIKKTVDAYSEQEKAEKRLADAMQRRGILTDEALKDNIAYAASLQKITEFSDEAIIAVQEMLTRFGAEGEMLKKLTKATLDLAAAKKMDLGTAADLVSKAIGSSTNALTRYGVEIEGAAGSTERMQSAVNSISKLFGGAAQASADTYAGRLKKLQNQFDDLLEQIGSFFIPIVSSLVSKIQSVITSVSDFIKENNKLASVLAISISALAALGGGFGSLLLILPTIASSIGILSTAITTLLIPSITKLFVLIQAHPLVALASAITLVTAGIYELTSLYIKNKESAENLMKTKEDILKKHKEEADLIRENISLNKYKTDTDKQVAVTRFEMLQRNIKLLEREIEIEKEASKKRVQIRKDMWQEMEDDEVEALANELEAHKQWIEDITDAMQDMADEMNGLTRDMFQTDLDIWQARLENVAMVTSQLRSTVGAYYDYLGVSAQNDKERDLKDAAEKYKVHKEYIDKNVTDEKERVRMLSELEQAYAAERENIEALAAEKERERKRAMKPFLIAEAVANTALAVTKALTSAVPPLNFVMAGLVAAEGALHIATIQAQEFARGGIVPKSGIALVGEEGAELVELPAGARVRTADETRRMLSPSFTFNIKVLDPESLSESVWERIAGRVQETLAFEVGR